jgi:non-homologous end joining protein Ku
VFPSSPHGPHSSLVWQSPPFTSPRSGQDVSSHFERRRDCFSHDHSAVKLAVDLIEQESGKFEPEKMPNEYARAVHELVQAKIEQRAPEVEIETETRETPKVVNIMDALKRSMQARGQAKVRQAVRKKAGKAEPKRETRPSPGRSKEMPRRTAH